MTLIDRYKRWRRDRRRRNAAKAKKSQLREFVYLDDVSVYSLIASRLGAVATEFTEIETASLTSDISGSASAGVPLAKAKVESRLGATQTQSGQVLRKAIVQTTFKELYELEESRLALKLFDSSSALAVDECRKMLSEGRWEALPPRIVDPDSLGRGELIEVEVELSAEPIFQLSTIASSIVELMQESPELSHAVSQVPGIGEMAGVTGMIERLLVGLIPIRGRIVDREVAERDGKEWIVGSEALVGFASEEFTKRLPLYVVGVAEEALFWKDIRRILFSGSRFRVLCRIARPGIQDDWTPVKLIDVLREVAPGLALQTDIAVHGAIEAMRETRRETTIDERLETMRASLIDYAISLSDHYGHRLTVEELETAGLPTQEQCAGYRSVAERRSGFGELTQFVETLFGFQADRIIAANLRGAALMAAGLGVQRQIAELSPQLTDSSPVRTEERYLDTEIVAMYW